MIFTDTVECPYCEHDNDITDGLTVSALEKRLEQRAITKGQKDLKKYREGNRWI